MDDEQLTDLMFPINGIDRSMEFELQPDRTTPIGLNVRGFEAQTQRQRGGSRPGIDKYIGAQVGSVSAPLQHLTYVVLAQNQALITGDDTAGGTTTGAYITDPSSNNGGPGGGYGVLASAGSIVLGPWPYADDGPGGGAGQPSPVIAGILQPNPLVGNALSPPASLLIPPPPFPPLSLGNRNPGFGGGGSGPRAVRAGGSGVQPNRIQYTVKTASGPNPLQETITNAGKSGFFSIPLTLHSLLFAAFANTVTGDVTGVGAGAVTALADTAGNSWIQIGTTQTFMVDYPDPPSADFYFNGSLSIWYCINQFGGVTNQLIPTWTGAINTPSKGNGEEWGGIHTSPLESSAHNASTLLQTSNAVTSGSITSNSTANGEFRRFHRSWRLPGTRTVHAEPIPQRQSVGVRPRLPLLLQLFPDARRCCSDRQPSLHDTTARPES